MNSNPNPNYRLPMGITLNCVSRCDPAFAINFKEIQENLRKVMKMFQPKFKIGDQVRVKKDLKVHERRGGYPVTPQIYCMRGNTAIVTSIGGCRSIPFVQLDNKFLYFSPEMLERVKPEKIVIYQNGNKVVAKNTANGKTAEARCNPSDDFDFNIGAKLAFERLVNSEPEKPKYYSSGTRLISRNFPEHDNYMNIYISGISNEFELQAFTRAIRSTARRINYNRTGEKIGYKITLDLQSNANQAP